VTQGGRVNFMAQGYQPFTTVNVQVLGPVTSGVNQVRANANCTVFTAFDITPFDPPGNYTVQSTGPSYFGGPMEGSTLTLSAPFVVQQGGPTATSTTTTAQTTTPTGVATCPFPTAYMSNTSIVAGQSITFGGEGFRPGAMVNARFEDPTGSFEVPWFVSGQIGPAAASCSVSSLFTVNQNVPPGRYRLNLSGPNHFGSTVTARVEFEVRTGQVPTLGPPTPGPGVGPSPTPVSPTGQVAPIAVDQTLAAVGGSLIPTVGQTTVYDHRIRIVNTSARAIDLSIASAPGAGLLWASSQGQSISVTFDTEYGPDTRVVSTSANVGTATSRGTSIVWDGTLAAGQSVEIRTSLEQTPQTALALNEVIRGQSISVRDERGVSLTVPPAAQPRPPQLPPAQRVVQPAPPPVDPTTGSRYFTETGFSVVNDDIWVYYHRRGGYRTFGPPISRQFMLSGIQMQLFAKALLQVDAEGRVSAANLLESPFLPYDALGDLQLPPAEPGVIAAAPDPALPNFAEATQDFVWVVAAEGYDGNPTRFYSTFLTTVLFREAFFDGNGDPNLIPGFALEIWGLPTSGASYHIIGYEPGPPEGPELVPIFDRNIVMQRFQKGVMRYEAPDRRTAGVPLGIYVRALILGEALPDLATAADGSTPLWAQYNPEASAFIDRPEELPDSDFSFLFEPE
jgi:hypothetical protein